MLFRSKVQATTPKKVMVIGGGPAGMEAALTASGRGHTVVLYEKSERLGGMLNFAKHVDFKYGLYELAQVLEYKLSKSPVTVHLNTAATKETVEAEKPDVLFVAAGASPIIPRMDGIDGANVVLAGDVYGSEEKIGDNVVVLGGGLVGCETAAHLARKGKKVSIVEMREDVAIDADCFGATAVKVDMEKNGVQILTNTTGKSITGSGVVVCGPDGKTITLPADTVVNAVGFRSNSGLFIELAQAAPVVQALGDCRKPGKVTNAMSDAYYLALDI